MLKLHKVVSTIFAFSAISAGLPVFADAGQITVKENESAAIPSKPSASSNAIKKSSAKLALDELQRDMLPIIGINSEFTQLKKLSIFSKTLKITGRMTIKMPHYFKWEVFSPLKSTVTADGDTVTMWDEETNEKTTMSLKSNPVAGGIWTQIDSFFMGRYDRLKKMYDMKLLSKSPMTLRFTPRSKPLSTVMKNVTLTFANDEKGRYLQHVVMKEIGGDSTTIDFNNVKLSRKSK